MATVSDIIDGEVWEDGEGVHHRRFFIVKDVTGAGHQRTYRALTANSIPSRGDAHPSIPQLIAINKRAEPLGDPGVYRVEVNYAKSDPADSGALRELGDSSLQIRSAVTQESTIFDVNGQRLSQRYGTNAFQFYTADVQIPTLAMTFERIEANLAKESAKEFTGSINLATFGGFPTRTWLCTGIESSEFRDGLYRVRHEFLYKSSGWYFVPYYDLNGIIPPDVSEGDGIARFDVYPVRDFGKLGIAW